MKKNTKKQDAARTPSVMDATAAGVIEALAKQAPREGFENPNAAPRLYAELVRAHGPVYRGRGILPGWMIAMTTREGTPISRVYKVFGSIKASALALTLCRQHRLPLTFAEVNG